MLPAKGTKNEIPPAMERNRLWLLSSRGISLSMLPTPDNYPPGYNCTPKPYLVVSTKNVVSLGGKTSRVVEAIIVP